MRKESQPQPKRSEEVEASPTWEWNSSCVDELEQRVDSLIAGYNLERENSMERNIRLQDLLECKARATALQDLFKREHMPLLPERIAAIMKRIQETVTQKLQ